MIGKVRNWLKALPANMWNWWKRSPGVRALVYLAFAVAESSRENWFWAIFFGFLFVSAFQEWERTTHEDEDEDDVWPAYLNNNGDAPYCYICGVSTSLREISYGRFDHVALVELEDGTYRHRKQEDCIDAVADEIAAVWHEDAPEAHEE